MNKNTLTVTVETTSALAARSETLIPSLVESVTSVAKAELSVDKAEGKADMLRDKTGAMLDAFYADNLDIMPAMFCAKPSSRKPSGCIERAASAGFEYTMEGYDLGMGVYNHITNTLTEAGAKNVASSVQNITQKNSAFSYGSKTRQTDGALARAVEYGIAGSDAVDVRKKEETEKKQKAKVERKEREAKAESSKTDCLKFLQGELTDVFTNFQNMRVIPKEECQRDIGVDMLQEFIRNLDTLRNS